MCRLIFHRQMRQKSHLTLYHLNLDNLISFCELSCRINFHIILLFETVCTVHKIKHKKSIGSCCKQVCYKHFCCLYSSCMVSYTVSSDSVSSYPAFRYCLIYSRSRRIRSKSRRRYDRIFLADFFFAFDNSRYSCLATRLYVRGFFHGCCLADTNHTRKVIIFIIMCKIFKVLSGSILIRPQHHPIKKQSGIDNLHVLTIPLPISIRNTSLNRQIKTAI